MIAIVENTIDVPTVLASVLDPSAGGVDLFVGTTRESADGRKVLRLEYEVYAPMAVAAMERIAQEAFHRWRLTKISMVHRSGTVGVGEASVVIAVSAPHRNEAFLACRYLIDTLKKEVPIWKKEFVEGGESWIGLPPQGDSTA